MSEIADIREALQSPNTSATFLIALVRRDYGDEALDWDPLTLAMELQADYGVDVSSEGMNRIAAMQIVMTSNAFFNRVDAWSAICNTLPSGEPYFIAFDPVSVEELAATLAEVALNRDLLPFSYPIKQYIYAILQNDGFSEENYPEPIKIALGSNPKREKVLNLESPANRDEVENYVDEVLKDIIRDFNKVPSMAKIDDYLYKDLTLNV